MSNLNKRILTSLIIFPISIFFIFMCGNYIVSFLYAILILGNFEVFSAFKRRVDFALGNVLGSNIYNVLGINNKTHVGSFH